MEAIVFVIVLAALGLLAARFGADSRDGLVSEEHHLAAHGVTWPERLDARHLTSDVPVRYASRGPEPDRPTPFRAGGAVPISAAPGSPHRFPTLVTIERASGDAAGAFSASAHAARLEQRAQDLVDALWSDTVWVTGLVSETALRRVRDALEREKIALERAMTVLSPPLPFVADADARASATAPPVRVA